MPSKPAIDAASTKSAKGTVIMHTLQRTSSGCQGLFTVPGMLATYQIAHI